MIFHALQQKTNVVVCSKDTDALDLMVFVYHCVKSVQIRSYFWSAFFCIRIEYGDLRSKSPYSIQIQENADQK